ncbi:Replicative DNA helicase [Bacteroidales bacterium Barb6]|nr:Replicative DNA helicase [Bacteroidales bacterium Barb6]OAV72588.1 Replicative DNA helicase [Bacteroidales bacterium Barb6]
MAKTASKVMFTNNPSPGLDPCLLFPQAVDMENAVIGAVLLESKVFPEVEGILSAADFYSERNKAIFAAASNLGRKRQPVDVLTVMEELKSTGKAEEAGGYACLAKLMSGITSSAHVVRHAQIVKQKSVARQIILLASSIQRQAYDETADIADVMESLEKALTEINTNSVSGIESLSMPAALKKAKDKQLQPPFRTDVFRGMDSR